MNAFPSTTKDFTPGDRARFELFLNVFVRNPQPISPRRRTLKR